jgi:hypothetical protein
MSIVAVRSALEAGVNAMAGMVAITSSSVAAATVITTPEDHGLLTGSVVAIVGHSGSTPPIDGMYAVTVTGVRTFTIPKTVTVAGTGGAFTVTAWENLPFKPPAVTIPYQAVHVLFADPDNPVVGPGYSDQGYMQVSLMYPLQKGTLPAGTRAKLIRDAFYRGRSLTNSGVVVTIDKTPAIGNGMPDVDRWNLPVKIPFRANFLT